MENEYLYSSALFNLQLGQQDHLEGAPQDIDVLSHDPMFSSKADIDSEEEKLTPFQTENMEV